VCVLPGLYQENVRIRGRVNVVVHGCGPRTRVRAPIATGTAAQPAFLVAGSSGITIEKLAIEAGPRSALHVENSRFVTLRGCIVQMRDVASLWQSIYSRGDDVLIEHNTIEIVTAEGGAPAVTVPPQFGEDRAPAGVATMAEPVRLATLARGGIQLAGGSDRVRVAHNRIRGGTWNGITLGSLETPDVEDSDTPDLPESEDHCAQCRPIDVTAPATGG
jgi:hypothetical protein